MRIFLALLFLCCLASASEVLLKEKLGFAPTGSFLVLEQNRTFTLLYIHQRDEHKLVIEEVSIPAAHFAKHPMNWKVWFEKGAPGHTGWIISQINLMTGSFEETFSYTHRGWIDMSASNQFLTTLLNLKFQEVPDSERRKIGLPPGYHKVDHRPLWTPRLVMNGQVVAHVPFRAYKARWPADGTDLSRKYVEIYLPEPQTADQESPYPMYFPYWLEVEGKIGSAKIRVVDSGINANSPKGSLPKRRATAG